MENILGLIGTIIGALGFTLAVFVAVMQAKEQKMHAQEMEMHAQEMEMHTQELEMHAQEREIQKQEMERQKQEMEIQKQEKARNERLMFLADRIFDSSIPRELRQPFYEEYISMKGNGTAVRFWQLEAEREKKLLHGNLASPNC
jgi:predicted Holliday junction resolvase-like endonuclease